MGTTCNECQGSGFYNAGVWEWINYPPSWSQYQVKWSDFTHSGAPIASYLASWDNLFPNNEFVDSGATYIPPDDFTLFFVDSSTGCGDGGPACTRFSAANQLYNADKGGFYHQGGTIFIDRLSGDWQFTTNGLQATLLHEIGHFIGLNEQYDNTAPPGTCNDDEVSIMDTGVLSGNTITDGCDGHVIQPADQARVQAFYAATQVGLVTLFKSSAGTMDIRWFDNSYGEWGYWYRLYVCGKSCSVQSQGSYLQDVAKYNGVPTGSVVYHDQLVSGLTCGSSQTYYAQINSITYMYGNSPVTNTGQVALAC